MNHKVLTSSFKRTKNITSKKLLMLLTAYSLSLSPAFSQGTWSSRDTLPDSAMFQGISGFSIGNYGYAGLGSYTGASASFDDLWQFDASTNSWTKKASFPGRARVAPACFVICDTAYLVTGSITSGGACVTECWAYYPATNTWAQKANFPGPARTYAVGFAIDGKGYVGTGANEYDDFRKDFYRFNPDSNTWTRVADFGGTARDGDCGFAVNGKGYVCFGQDSTARTYFKDMWEYDPVANTWTQKSDYPAEGILLPSGFAICNNIYVGSGDSEASDLDERFWKYNTVSDSWTQMANVPAPTRIEGAAFAIGDTGYYGFGADSARPVINIFDKFYANDSCQITDSCNEITSYSTLNTNSQVIIYPNPFKDISYIIIPHNSDMPVFTLYDITGRKATVNISYSHPYYIIDRGILTAGIYVLSIISDIGTYYKKLIITN
jgi:N-acetylneuraminic acid mutarotase